MGKVKHVGKTIILKCDLCGKKNARELQAWFEWKSSYRPIVDNLVQEYIDGINSNGWARYNRTIYLCSDHHTKLDALITKFVVQEVKKGKL